MTNYLLRKDVIVRIKNVLKFSMALAALGFFTLAGISRSDAVSFTPLGDLTKAFDVSADGSVVVGVNHANFSEAFSWTSSGGIIGLGAATGEAHGVSADGSVMVGRQDAWRWTTGGGMVELGYLSETSEPIFSDAYGVSGDGSVVVGRSTDNTSQAFRWTAGGGMVGLGFLPGDNDSGAYGISGDGSVVVGESSSLDRQAFRWTSGGGMVGLGVLGGDHSSIANGVSGDGSAVVGTSMLGSIARDREAFRWTSGGGMVGLGFLPGDGDFFSEALDVSGDGSVVVGRGRGGFGEAFVWDGINGMQSLSTILTGSGVDMTGWNLWYATGISDDGQTIVGYGKNPDGIQEAYVVNLGAEVQPVPEPTTIALLGIGLVGLAGAEVRRRRKKRAKQ
jgi:probable HAF family extracellular repeat protein